MPARDDKVFGILRIKEGDDLKTIYAKAKKAFTAADLQRFTEIEETFPARDLLKELKAIHREETRKPKGRRNKKA